MKTNQELDKLRSMDTIEAGKLGGDKLLKLRGKEYFKEISKKGVEARKAKKTEAKLPIA